MHNADIDQFAFDDEFWAEMERRDREMDEDPSIALTHEEVMESVREAIRQMQLPA